MTAHSKFAAPSAIKEERAGCFTISSGAKVLDGPPASFSCALHRSRRIVATTNLPLCATNCGAFPDTSRERVLMPRYIIERNVGQLTREEIFAGGRKSNEVLAEMPGVIWIRSYISDAEGKIYCEYDAPNAEALREHALRAGIPVDRISEVALEINPAMFR
jgi:hypothetical protein